MGKLVNYRVVILSSETQITIIFKIRQVFSDGNSKNSSDDDEEIPKTQLKTEFIVKIATHVCSGGYTLYSD